MIIDIHNTSNKKVNLYYLFYTFLKIGLVSFGGHMALISVVQREMADKDEVVDNDIILDAVSIASLLPGPLAVNVVTYIGYYLRGRNGAIVSMIGILLPACILMLILSYAYFTYTYTIKADQVMYFVISTVGAIILSTGVLLFKKETIGNVKKMVLCLTAILIQVLFKSYFITIGLIIFGGIIGMVLNLGNSDITKHRKTKFSFGTGLKTKATLIILIILELLFISNTAKFIENIYLKIGVVFSGISLSLFGGGYVMIPIMQSLFVNEVQWLTQQEFIDAIAFSQITPGPILVSATFIGYKIAGVMGAALATMAIFIPSAVLMIIVSGLFRRNKEHYFFRNILGGIKAVVIGLIIASGIEILQKMDRDFLLIGITVLSFFLNYKYKVSPVYLILASIFAGIILKVYL